MTLRIYAYIKTVWKAVYAGAVAFVGATAVVLVDDASLGDITDGQWFTIAGVTLAAVGGTWAIPNRTR